MGKEARISLLRHKQTSKSLVRAPSGQARFSVVAYLHEPHESHTKSQTLVEIEHDVVCEDLVTVGDTAVCVLNPQTESISSCVPVPGSYACRLSQSAAHPCICALKAL